jgi:hypothetical protein
LGERPSPRCPKLHIFGLTRENSGRQMAPYTGALWRSVP